MESRRRPRPEALEQFELARELTAQGRRDQAMDAYLRVLDLEPDFAEAHVNLGILYSRLGEPHVAEGIRCLRRAVVLKPEGLRAHYNLGVALLEQPDGLDEAVTAFEAVLALDPRHRNALYALSVAHSRLGNVERAQEMYARYQRSMVSEPERPKRWLWSKRPPDADTGGAEARSGEVAAPQAGSGASAPEAARAAVEPVLSAVQGHPGATVGDSAEKGRELWLYPASEDTSDENPEERVTASAPVLRVRFRTS